MRGKYLAAVAVGIMGGVGGTAVVVRQPPAQAQDRKAALEHRVVFTYTDDPTTRTKEMTDQFAALAKDGWEYVGPAAEYSRPGPAGGYGGAGGVYLVFKRQKP